MGNRAFWVGGDLVFEFLTVLAVPKIVVPKECKQVGQTVSGERGKQVTFVGTVTASGEAFLPVCKVTDMLKKDNDGIARGQYSVQEEPNKIEDSLEATDFLPHHRWPSK
ncbi:hypothetical protein ILUMI_27272 [Ignelater luminosus]|uniref:Uncharacterized protein n=1 Tax=Ignelater luminosus TaxID=2038154 RepID=A0A8K0FVP8_IGNLU|nr:hypothetical protein ILUMI_27272 [Ignelater luminosus]